MPSSAAGKSGSSLAGNTLVGAVVRSLLDRPQSVGSVCAPLTELRWKSALLRRLTELATVPVSNCGQENHAVPVPEPKLNTA